MSPPKCDLLLRSMMALLCYQPVGIVRFVLRTVGMVVAWKRLIVALPFENNLVCYCSEIDKKAYCRGGYYVL